MERPGGWSGRTVAAEQLKSLSFNTFYSNKVVFLRELISTGSNARDQIHHEPNTDLEETETQPHFFIKIIPDQMSSTIMIK
eukprot:12807326-Heterocapsa_arctica.AAC.1